MYVHAISVCILFVLFMTKNTEWDVKNIVVTNWNYSHSGLVVIEML